MYVTVYLLVLKKQINSLDIGVKLHTFSLTVNILSFSVLHSSTQYVWDQARNTGHTFSWLE